MAQLATMAANGIRYTEILPASAPGAGTFLLLHGLGGSLEQWGEVSPLLGRSARTISIDLPGFGKSRTLRGRFDLDQVATQILTFCRIKQITRCTVVSHSITSVIAAKLATADPKRFQRVVFVSGTLPRASDIVHHPAVGMADLKLFTSVTTQFLAGIFPVPRPVLVSLSRSTALRRLLLWPFVARPSELPTDHLVDLLTGTGSLSVLRVLIAAKSIDYDRIVATVAQPVDIVAGANDRLINDDDITRVRKLIHVAHEATIENCGHWPWLEQPVQLVNFILTSEIK